MNSATSSAPIRRLSLLVPTLTRQCWLFMIGSSLFALGSAPGISSIASTATVNVIFFIGAWFFTTAGLEQLALSGASTVEDPAAPGGRVYRAEWLAAAWQSIGTVLFNVSTTAALHATTIGEQQHRVWRPDAGGSVAFLISAVFVLIAYAQISAKRFWNPADPGWWGAQINLIGCIAFGVSAIGSFIFSDGSTLNTSLATWGTFIGAICFFLASLIALPRLPWNR